MNKINNAVFAIFVATGAATAQAADVNPAELEECKSQVSAYYGGQRDMRLVGQRHFQDGTRMKLAVYNDDPVTGYSTTRLASCWLGAENYQAYSNNGPVDPMIAEVEATPASLPHESQH